ncbi:SDR family NAD(P)-dependent oxidoreductase [Chlorobaculum thiosulfatiphilum]|uniref:SDR family NAD(P)-dependent oxidoreductase n=1 Tax=Chlorobaculum thiosulfatiphilum TaxID=115852 RepID=A0A5C4S4Y5_CHLTI|nr:SDR family NAD(P)-dependent oxidoreductase [Chlorobaculum thiosulfatiphilum]TNJ38506.1 SDR family NAD(P)-dependent oxidoreductase [Chlorobaculum thiosulfatiphilum]
MPPLTLCITGSTDGIGLAAAKRFAAAGHRVIVHGRSASRIKAASAEIARVTGAEPLGFVEADFTDLDAVCSMGRELVERFPDLALLVNNAAVYMPTRTLTPEGYETTFCVNYLAPELLTGVVKPLLIANGGSVLNVSSVDHHSAVFDSANMQGERGYSGYDAYARSKLFNIMFTSDSASDVRSNSLDPGVIATKLLHAGWSLAGDDVSVGGEEVFETVMEITRNGWNGEYFENLRPARCSPIALDPAARRELAALTGEMLRRFIF